MKLRPLLVAALLPFAAAGYACSDDNDSPPAETPNTPDASRPDTYVPGDASAPEDSGPRAIELEFAARVGGEAFECGKTYSGMGTSAADATAGDFRFFVHDVRLIREDGEEVALTLDKSEPWQSTRLALLDFENKKGECQFGTTPTNGVVRGKAPSGSYKGIVFDIGVPEDLNHVNAELADAPLPGSKLNWNWTSGFIHFAVEMRSTKTTAGPDGGVERVPSFYAHVGSALCSGDPTDGGTPSCQRKNRPRIRLTNFDPSRHVIVVDAKKLFEGSNLDVNTPSTIPGCMSSPNDPECGPIFDRLGLDPATGAPKADNSQSVFSVADR